MRAVDLHQSDLTGSLLVATPTLFDQNFRRTIIFVTRHEAMEGALGVILNRPCGINLGDLTDSPESLKEIPVFEGGPVEQQNVLLAGIQLIEHGTSFETFEQQHANSADNIFPGHRDLRAFTGYAGWSEGQLEEEIRENSWVIIPPTTSLLSAITTPEEGLSRWREIMKGLGPFYRLAAGAPDDPSIN